MDAMVPSVPNHGVVGTAAVTSPWRQQPRDVAVVIDAPTLATNQLSAELVGVGPGFHDVIMTP
jgi:hypothetical protein